MEPSFTRAGQFPDTPWTQVRLAGGADTLARESFGTLCRLYWAPLYGFARRSGMAPEEAEDVAQSFFLHLMQEETIQTADSEKGRMRSFLLGSMKRFISNWRRDAAAVKRGGRLQRVEFDTREVEAVCARSADGLSADAFYERRWAVALLEHAMRALEAEQVRQGKSEHFRVLSEFLTSHGKEAHHAEAAAKLGQSEGSVRVAVHRLRTRYRQLLREQVALTVGGAAEVEDELRHLLELFGN
ncbi:MAG: sigma-70 family RNA polymerase sigma factor [Verrucomicrobiaceae bacterium]|nr:sigma-70 family RNA polymerase sigma factor [Verrucomicrobiaceae bacterium]